MTLDEAIKERYKDSKSMWGLKAFKLGFIASQEGESEYTCPYADLRTDSGKITFARAYRIRWFEGYRMHKSSLGCGV